MKKKQLFDRYKKAVTTTKAGKELIQHQHLIEHNINVSIGTEDAQKQTCNSEKQHSFEDFFTYV